MLRSVFARASQSETKPPADKAGEAARVTTKEFPTLAVLTVTSGRLLTQPEKESDGNGTGQIYQVLGWQMATRRKVTDNE